MIKSNARATTLTLLSTSTALLFSLLASQAHAIPPGISVNVVTPTNGNTLLVSRTAANNPLNAPTFQLKADVYFNNTSAFDQTVTFVNFSYPGSGIADRSYTPQSFPSNAPPALFTMSAGDVGRVPIYDGLGRDLPTPLPNTVEISIFFGFDPDPVVIVFDLAFRNNAVPLGAHFFPGKSTDLVEDEYWHFRTRHTVDAGGGGGTLNPSTRSQRYALDMDIVRWDEDSSAWRTTKPGTAANIEDRANSDYWVWGQPLYAIGDGTVVSCYRGEADHDPDSFNNITFENGGGNGLIIQHGSDQVEYYHFMFGTIPLSLCPSDGQNDNLSIPVEAGDYLGLVGNTGRSTNAHLHIHVTHIPDSGPNTQEGVPLQFLNIRTLADQDTVQNLGQTPNLRPLHGMTLHRHALILPNPCGIDLPQAGFTEVSRHGIPAECYQDTFNMIVKRGYRPTFVDGYDVNGDTVFQRHISFVGCGLGGPSWPYWNAVPRPV